ncbi:unnamed protein product [Bursaphelenchus okinawaensis]|uniref:NADH:flavin oxidoreductase/NADH oxidase N-terminal domain-containing protein n=1 Tax=Bursaphelenchus okinawaensis TaxID=465554 RepID=A0A811L0K9_9BILA|nr:unnamed protein product [Bursaphelenchus okinawaensis]CAG9114353.1 unnamed protein product [Bursaphelenchus okinawaensis]
MVNERWPVELAVDPETLEHPLKFKTALAKARNRLLKAAMSENIATVDPHRLQFHGVPTQRLINLYEKFGAGGWGAVITGSISVDHKHYEGPGAMIISRECESEARRAQFRRLTEAAKSHKGLILAQLNHNGRQTLATVNPTPYSASDVQLETQMKGSFFGKPLPLTLEQIQTEVVDRFVYAALFAYDTGFNGVQIAAAFGTILSQFLSPSTNLRNDEYGGSLKNRCRVIDEIYYGIRSKIPAGSGFIVSIKLNSAEFQNGGLETNDVVNMAKHFDELGFDFIELTGGNLEAPRMEHVKESTKKREAYFIEFAAAIKPNIQNAIVYLTGGFRTAPAMIAAIRNNETDGIGLARAAAAEPDLPKKIINQGIQSAAATVFADNFMISMPAANTQLAQAGSSDLSETNGDLCHGISDFSNPAEAEIYQKAMFKWFGDLCEAGSKGRAEIGVFEYHTRSKNAPQEHKGFLKRLLESI